MARCPPRARWISPLRDSIIFRAYNSRNSKFSLLGLRTRAVISHHYHEFVNYIKITLTSVDVLDTIYKLISCSWFKRHRLKIAVSCPGNGLRSSKMILSLKWKSSLYFYNYISEFTKKQEIKSWHIARANDSIDGRPTGDFARREIRSLESRD